MDLASIAKDKVDMILSADVQMNGGMDRQGETNIPPFDLIEVGV